MKQTKTHLEIACFCFYIANTLGKCKSTGPEIFLLLRSLKIRKLIDRFINSNVL